MIKDFDLDSLAVVYVITKAYIGCDKDAWEEPSVQVESEWYSALDLNQIINN